MNPNSKKGKAIASKKKLIAFDRPVPLGAIYKVEHKERFLGYSHIQPFTTAEISRYAHSFPENPHKKFVLTKDSKITRADIF
jgi:hypothetical protein